ncbi:MAG: DUF3267 domain-containing protein [Eubacteriales bacterium]|nr:DUF3267 domain-containing protein [Eubacteriales bacterium]MDY3333048.1 DUF3267 domain-containing protein [Gallibacter sp.]
MKLIYKGVFDGDIDKLPVCDHHPNAVRFKEFETPEELAKWSTTISVLLMVVSAIFYFIRAAEIAISFQVIIGIVLALLAAFPHEFLHAICFKKEVYLYTYLQKGMIFVVGPERMSKQRFIVMSMLPNVVFGFIPYMIAMIFPEMQWLAWMGIIAIGMGAGDFYNVYNAATQLPRGAMTYLYKFSSYWYIQ